MADSNIGALKRAPEVNDDSLFVAEQNGEAVSVTGAQFKGFARDCVKPYAESAEEDSAKAANASAAAQSALAGVQQAIKNIPEGSTPIVDDLTTGGSKMALSAEQGKILGRRPNPNLFHNWYFGNPINQRGQTEYTKSGYAIDRWFANSASSSWISVFLHEDHLTLTHATSVWHHFAQQCDKKQIIVGETYTISALTNHGVLTRTFVYTGEDYTRSVGHDWCLYTTQRAGHPIFGLRTNVSGATLDVYAMKLEQGSVQTIAHQDSTGAWVLNEIPDKNEELLKCVQFTADSYDSYAGKVVLHTGNKTSGSYTGNSTARTIDTGGLGDFALLYGTDVVGVAGPEGTMKASLSAGPSFDKTVTCRNGILTFGGTGMNLSTVPYHYYIP